MLGVLTQFAVDYNYNYTYAPTDGAAAGAFVGTFLFIWLLCMVVAVVIIVATWKLFVKAGKPGWASIVPFYNTWVLAEIAGKPGWWLFLYFIPIVNIVVSVLIALGLARNFGKSDLFGIVGLWLFSAIGYLILGFGDATYTPVAEPSA